MVSLRTLLIGGALIATPALAQDTATPATAPAAAGSATAAASTTPAAPNVVAGAPVSDTAGAAVGTIESVANGIATLSTGATKAGIPIASFAQGPNGLVIGMTKAQIDAQAAAATQTAQAATPAGPPKFEIGAKVVDAKGAKVGTVKAVTGGNVTVASATASAQLPKASFAQGADGLVIGLSPEQFEAAAKAAGGKKS